MRPLLALFALLLVSSNAHAAVSPSAKTIKNYVATHSGSVVKRSFAKSSTYYKFSNAPAGSFRRITLSRSGTDHGASAYLLKKPVAGLSMNTIYVASSTVGGMRLRKFTLSKLAR